MGLRKGQSSGGQRTFDLKEFSGGWDLREGLYSEEQDRFTDLLNAYITVGKKVRRRPPLKKSPGTYDAVNAQGMIYAGGKWYSIAMKGAAPIHTISAITLNTLLFDNPDYGTTWTLIQTKVFNNVVCAVIKHTFPGATVTVRYMLHVFDGSKTKPTYVEDPACPTNWSPSFPLGLYGLQSNIGAYDANYVPVMGVGGNHLWLSRPDGNPACSKVDNPRQWNQRSVNDLLSGGEMWYFVIPNNGASLRRFIVSTDGADLPDPAKWSAYVLEYLDATGTWKKFLEDATGADPIVDKHYTYSVTVSRLDATARETQLNVFWIGATDVTIRWRAIAGLPPVAVTAGLTWDATFSTQAAGTITCEGVNRANGVTSIGVVTASQSHYACAILASTDVRVPAGANLNVNYHAAGSYPVLTGLQRYFSFIQFQFTTSGGSAILSQSAFQYGATVGKESDWYLAKLSDYLVNQAGFGEASFLNTQNNNPNGGYLKAMGNLLRHMTFSYKSRTQLWTIAANPSGDAFQDAIDIGVGENQSNPVPVNFYDLVMLPSSTGLRGFNMQQGLLVNSLQDNNIGEPIMAATLPDLTVACWWPHLGMFVTAGVLSGAVQWFVLSESRESKISAWSRWVAAGITTIDAMVPLQDRLYVKSGTGVYYFDASRTITENGTVGTGVFRDSNDPAGDGNAYVTRGTWHFNDMQRPGSDKDYHQFDVVQTGIATWSFGFLPRDLTAVTATIPVDGTSMGGFPFSLGFCGSGVAPIFTSTDETGFLLEGISIGFSYLGRG